MFMLFAWAFLSVYIGFPTTALQDKDCPRIVLVGNQTRASLFVQTFLLTL